jgi:hypothetical protein
MLYDNNGRILQVGCVYEFTISLAPTHHHLGKYVSSEHTTQSILFTLYASQYNFSGRVPSDFFDNFFDSKYRCRLTHTVIIKQVMLEDLPLYIGWIWKAPRFMEHLKGQEG